jgi:hypothetical protein
MIMKTHAFQAAAMLLEGSGSPEEQRNRATDCAGNKQQHHGNRSF